jgi:hypothetical protein
MKTHITHTRLALGIAVALSLSTTAQAQVESITLNGQENIAFTVTNLTNVAGFGAHFSTTASTDGYGGAYAECHLISGSVEEPDSRVIALCYDGYLDPNNHANEYRLNLGAKKLSNDRDALSSVTFIVSETGVKVKAERIASNTYTNESYSYTIESTFPIRQSTGFWSTGQIYYRENSVLNERRKGENYVLSVAENVPVDGGNNGGGSCPQEELEAAYDKGYNKGKADCTSVGPNHCTNPSYRYDPRKKLGILDLPAIDLQLLEPFTGTWSTKFDAFSATMEEVPGTMYFQITKTQVKPDKVEAKPEAVAK